MHKKSPLQQTPDYNQELSVENGFYEEVRIGVPPLAPNSNRNSIKRVQEVIILNDQNDLQTFKTINENQVVPQQMDFGASLTFSVRKKNSEKNSESSININPESNSTILDQTGPKAPRKYTESFITKSSN